MLKVRVLAAGLALVSMMITMPARADVTVVEYYHAAFDHYFITPVAAEIALLDARAPPFQDWSRTGFGFRAHDSKAAPAGSVPICRFFNSSFAPKSSHFYAPRGLGCETTLANYPDWGLEDDQLFATMLPDAGGVCPTGTAAVYRLYNNGQSGAPNHRFVTSLVERQKMLDKGYVAEGAGIGVGMCVPGPVVSRTTAEGFWQGTTDQGQALRMIILDDGTFYIVYSAKGSDLEAGVLYGSGSAVSGKFTSTDAKEYRLSPAAPSFIGGASPINGTYVPGSSMQLTIGTSTVSATYVAAYDQPANLASFAGNYQGSTGHITEQRNATASMDTTGNLTIYGVQCEIRVAAAARGAVNVLNISVTSGSCYQGPGVMIYDDASRKLFALAAFYNGLLGFPDLWYAIVTRD